MQDEYDILADAERIGRGAALAAWLEAECCAKSAVTKQRTARRRLEKAIAAYHAAETQTKAPRPCDRRARRWR